MSREKTLPTRSERVSWHRALFGICMLSVWACWGLRRFPFGCRICSYLSGISEAPQAALGWGCQPWFYLRLKAYGFVGLSLILVLNFQRAKARPHLNAVSRMMTEIPRKWNRVISLFILYGAPSGVGFFSRAVKG